MHVMFNFHMQPHSFNTQAHARNILWFVIFHTEYENMSDGVNRLVLFVVFYVNLLEFYTLIVHYQE